MSSIVTFFCIYSSFVKDFIWKLGFTDKSTVFKKIVKTTALGKSKTYIPQVSSVKFNHLPGDSASSFNLKKENKSKPTWYKWWTTKDQWSPRDTKEGGWWWEEQWSDWTRKVAEGMKLWDKKSRCKNSTESLAQKAWENNEGWRLVHDTTNQDKKCSPGQVLCSWAVSMWQC